MLDKDNIKNIHRLASSFHSGINLDKSHYGLPDRLISKGMIARFGEFYITGLFNIEKSMEG